MVFYLDNSWSSTSLTIRTANYTSGSLHSISGTSVRGGTTWVAFNLPVGIVLTLAQYPNRTSNIVGDLGGLGAVVDLIGTGRTEAVDLDKVKLNDEITAFFWRPVDLTVGVIELFSEPSYAGWRTAIFLSEWGQGVPVSLGTWFMKDRVRSARWLTLSETQSATLFDNVDGTGVSYDNIKGWGSIKSISDLGSVGFANKISSFSWKNIAPVKEIIVVPKVALSSYIQNATGLSTASTGVNNGSLDQKQIIAFTKSEAETVTVEVANTVSVGSEITASYSVNGLFASASLSVTLSFNYTTSTTKTTSWTKSSDISISHEFNVKARSSFTCELTQVMAILPVGTRVTTTATRWYNVELPGTTMDPLNANLYKREETLYIDLSGALACGTDFEFEETLLDGSDPTTDPSTDPPGPGPDNRAVKAYWNNYWCTYWKPYWKQAAKHPDFPKPPLPLQDPPEGVHGSRFKTRYKTYWNLHWEAYFEQKAAP
ncbi:MAG: ETX/MTX2 family pore-forming toxin [Nannocystis sp.]|uniref:ETX/MTX2 family pore-forming toxin n=1 Tax=Nannocystis sp. TaxID=1962667 RepID=UPI00242432C5|nr:ETX/MTX2 family pore-forming toxin [Nannocystis sp.]MBK9757168.1 ETX/MTX2 family pore-forming toxin [Nannocystis sp.]